MNWRSQGYRKGDLICLTIRGISEFTPSLVLARVASAGEQRMAVYDLKSKQIYHFRDKRSIRHPYNENIVISAFKDYNECYELLNGRFKIVHRMSKEYEEYNELLSQYLAEVME